MREEGCRAVIKRKDYDGDITLDNRMNFDLVDDFNMTLTVTDHSKASVLGL